MASAYLDDRALLRISGDDARGFLQGLLTCNMDKVSPNAAGFGALLSPQGKILFDFLIVEDAEGFLLDTDGAQAQALAKRLSMYRLRAKVGIEPQPELGVLALWDGSPAPGLVFDDPRHAGLGRRAILPKAEAEATARAGSADYHAHRIVCGVPEAGKDFPWSDIFPHDADMDLVNGLDFRKGCYVGQEVVSRMEHRGTARKRVIPVMLRGAAPVPGTPIMAGETAIGSMGTAAPSGHALALIRTDKAEEAISANVTLIADTAIVELLPDHMPKG